MFFSGKLSGMKATTDEKEVGGRPAAPRSDRVRRVRDALGMTQEEFAREMGVSPYTLAKMEQQGREPGTQAGKATFAKFAKRAGVSLEKETAAQ
jgi:transcriptional regulator with XRE-family HTH domain